MKLSIRVSVKPYGNWGWAYPNLEVIHQLRMVERQAPNLEAFSQLSNREEQVHNEEEVYATDQGAQYVPNSQEEEYDD
ncbi:hypothetical protein Hanom_Chr08g00706311 [Helianthus anomalus]